MEALGANLPNLRVENAELCTHGRFLQSQEPCHPDDICHAGGAFRVTHVSFDAAQGATHRTALRQDRGYRAHLDRISERGSSAVGLHDITSTGGGLVESRLDQQLLRETVQCCKRRALAVVSGR